MFCGGIFWISHSTNSGGVAAAAENAENNKLKLRALDFKKNNYEFSCFPFIDVYKPRQRRVALMLMNNYPVFVLLPFTLIAAAPTATQQQRSSSTTVDGLVDLNM